MEGHVVTSSPCHLYYHPTQYDVYPFERFNTYSLQERCLEALSDGELGHLTCFNDEIGMMARFVAKIQHAHTFKPVLWEIETYDIPKAKRPTLQQCRDLQKRTHATLYTALRALLLAKGDTVEALTILERHYGD